MVLLSAGLALGTYVALRFLMAPKVEPNRESEAVDVVNEIARLGQRLPTADLRGLTTTIGVKARTLLTQLKDSKDNAAEGLFLVGQYLQQTQKGLELFLADRSRGAQARTESHRVLADLLTTVSERFDNLQISLDTQDDRALAGELKLLTQTLTDLDQFSLTLKQGNP